MSKQIDGTHTIVHHPDGSYVTLPRCTVDMDATGQLRVSSLDTQEEIRTWRVGDWTEAVVYTADGYPDIWFEATP